MSRPIETDVILRPEGRLQVLRSGEAGPAVVLLSGAGVDNAMLSWRHLIPALAGQYRVFALDWPKQGGSRPWRGIADHAALRSCVITLLDHYGLDRAALVGLSQGGAIAISCAQDYPGRVWALVAAAPAGIIDFPPGLHQLLYLVARMPGLTAWATRAVLGNSKAVAAFARQALFAGPVDDFDAIVDEIAAEIRDGGGGASDWQNASIGWRRMNVDLRPRLTEIACPTLFIQGDKDAGVKAEHTRRAASQVPGAEFVLLENTGHWSNRQVPERFNALVLHFLARHRPG